MRGNYQHTRIGRLDATRIRTEEMTRTRPSHDEDYAENLHLLNQGCGLRHKFRHSSACPAREIRSLRGSIAGPLREFRRQLYIRMMRALASYLGATVDLFSPWWKSVDSSGKLTYFHYWK